MRVVRWPGALLMFVVMSVLAGMLVAVAVTPAVAVAGEGTSGAVSFFEDLPTYLDVQTPQQVSSMYAEQGGKQVKIASFYAENRTNVTADQMADTLKQAAIDTEDPRYYDEGGIDVLGTLRGVAATVVGGDVQGGSSITQQYVKNVLVQQCEELTGADQAATEKKVEACYEDAAGVTPQRKLQEMRYAIAVNKKYSKDEILTGYLNIVGLGGRVYGAEAGAEHYFGVHAKDLSLVQSATLVAILNNPSNLRIDVPSDKDNGKANGYELTKERRDYVLRRMQAHGSITKAQMTKAIATPVTPKITETANGCSTAATNHDAGYFCDYVRDQVLQDPAFGKTAAARIATLDTKGLQIHTSLDLDLQGQAQSALSTYVPATMAGVDVGGSNVTVEPGTGRIMSMVQNTTYTQGDHAGAGATAVNYSADSGYGNSGGFQTGSTYKVFTLAEWLASGHTLSDSVTTSEHQFENAEFTNTCQNVAGGTWNVANAERVPSSMSVEAATVESINTAYAQMGKQLDLCKIAQLAQSMGIHRADGGDLTQTPSSILGVNELSPIDLAEAYAGFANGGIVCTPTAIDSVTEADGTKITPTPSSCTQGVSADVAGTVDYALQGVLSGSGTAASANPGDSVAKFAKTGTTDGDVQNWLVASSTKYTNATWVGNVQGNVSLANWPFLQGTTGYSAKFGVGKSMMAYLDQTVGGGALPAPSQAMIGQASKSSSSSSSSSSGSSSGQGTAQDDQTTPTTAPAAPAAPAGPAAPAPAATVAPAAPAARDQNGK
ncbi:transglycosylase domain-containing protein [Curtobacterium flaccumfaciens]|uniref:transglycosylase domain-containing protein n=1 Tax=Curtobacterium flaccumfaciens TaxID=2035 RepID=UPI001BDEF121|nr:transglycosylase domain-containing protein [Curtobacterium flaccumfaciens]MBT1608448.1 penicillin-binding protein [Curtobacterium flaccumfaciens pv. betae]MBT1658280.1 penicillin-binding protein [Curtobacterium flaccumfaciens pv. betae]MCS0471230.1 penicillin-binding protein [Curtobacterium flaccumfaciens pv. betae]MCS0474053.1 penicillin-binding protein [Curtobacterium flaccumfaciens pv. betae]MCS0477640.1 penicillin-binding protein [Curtobacterium flaccumfaciens pv. betae]